MSWLEGMKEFQWSWDRTYERVWNLELLCNVSSPEKLNWERKTFEVTKAIKEVLCSVRITGSAPKPGVWISPTASSQQSSSLESSLLQELSHPAQVPGEHFLILPRTLWPPTCRATLSAWVTPRAFKKSLICANLLKGFKKPGQLILTFYL